MMKNIRAKYFGDKNFYKMILAIALPIVIQSLFSYILQAINAIASIHKTHLGSFIYNFGFLQ